MYLQTSRSRNKTLTRRYEIELPEHRCPYVCTPAVCIHKQLAAPNNSKPTLQRGLLGTQTSNTLSAVYKYVVQVAHSTTTTVAQLRGLPQRSEAGRQAYLVVSGGIPSKEPSHCLLSFCLASSNSWWIKAWYLPGSPLPYSYVVNAGVAGVVWGTRGVCAVGVAAQFMSEKAGVKEQGGGAAMKTP